MEVNVLGELAVWRIRSAQRITNELVFNHRSVDVRLAGHWQSAAAYLVLRQLQVYSWKPPGIANQSVDWGGAANPNAGYFAHHKFAA